MVNYSVNGDYQQMHQPPVHVVHTTTTVQNGRSRGCDARVAVAAVFSTLALVLLVPAAVLPNGVAKDSVSVSLPHSFPIHATLAEAAFECGLFTWNVELSVLTERFPYSGSYSDWCSERATMFHVAEGLFGMSALSLLLMVPFACCGSCGVCCSRPKALGVMLLLASVWLLGLWIVLLVVYHQQVDGCEVEVGVNAFITSISIPIPLPQLSELTMGPAIPLAAAAWALVFVGALLCFWSAWSEAKKESAQQPHTQAFMPYQQQPQFQQQPQPQLQLQQVQQQPTEVPALVY